MSININMGSPQDVVDAKLKATSTINVDTSVTSVNGKKGTVVLNAEDIPYQSASPELQQPHDVEEALDQVATALGNKQATLVSGTNIKTINDTSLLGSGNISITESDPTVPSWAKQSTKPSYVAYEIGAQLETTSGQWDDVQEALDGLGNDKQNTLVSGTNIKTVNNTSLLGSGNITIAGNDDLYVVNVTLTEGGNITGTSDKTSQEIYEATVAGKIPVVRASLYGTYMVATLSSVYAFSEGGTTTYIASFTYEDQANQFYKYCTMQVIGTGVSLTFRDEYQTKLTFDSSPTISSGNPVTSNGIYNALSHKSEDFIITETYDLDEDVEVVDKTYAEILVAYNSGKCIYLVDNSAMGMSQPSNYTAIAQLTKYDADNGVFIFECNTGEYTHRIYSIDSNDEFNTVPKNYINRANATSGTKYCLTLSAINSTTPNFYSNSTANLTYDWSSTGSVDTLSLGSEYGTASGVNVQGKIQLYGTTAYGVTIDSGSPTANHSITLPNADGTIALVSDLSTKQSVSITDTGGYFTTDTVEGALQEIGAELVGVETLLSNI